MEIDVVGILSEYIGHNLLDIFLDDAAKQVEKINNYRRNYLRKDDKKVSFNQTEEELLEKLIDQLNYTFNWASQVNFRELDSPMAFSSSFIELEYFSPPRSLKSKGVLNQRQSYLNSFANESNIVIVGGPGSGKTTTAKKVIYDSLHKKAPFEVGQLPFVLRLRKIANNTHKNLYDLLMDYFNINLSFPPFFEEIILDKKGNKKKRRPQLDIQAEALIKKEIILKLLPIINPLIILDGYDEIDNIILKRNLVNDLEEISIKYPGRNFILTSRTSDFQFSIFNTVEIEVAELSNKQIESFIYLWYPSHGDREYLKSKLTNATYFNAIVRPLNLVHLFAIYNKHKRVPPQPKSIYKKIIWLLLERWDEERKVFRKTNYGDFLPDKKFDFLSKLAYLLTTRYKVKVFSSNHLQKCYDLLYREFSLPAEEMEEVVKELEGHTGIFIKSGYDEYEFSHLSLQEYLTGEVISRGGSLITHIGTLLLIPEELAIATILSSNPNKFFFDLIYCRLPSKWDNRGFFSKYLNRLILENPDFRDDPLLPYTLIRLYEYWKIKLNHNDQNVQYLRIILNSHKLDASLVELNEFYPLRKTRAISDGIFRIPKSRKHFYNTHVETTPFLVFDKYVFERIKNAHDNS